MNLEKENTKLIMENQAIQKKQEEMLFLRTELEVYLTPRLLV